MIQFFKHKAYEFRWAFFSGLLIGTTYIPFPPWALIFCFVPLWIHTLQSELSLKKVFWNAWVTQFTLTLIGFHWIAYTAREFGQMPWSVSIAALLLFCAFMHLYIPVSLCLVKYLKNKLKLGMAASLFLAALTLALFEQFWPVIFPWNLGYTLLWAKIPIYHFADIIGFAGLSALVLALNAWIGYIWTLHENNKKALSHLGALVLFLALLTVGGYFHGKKWNHFDESVKVSVIQANIANSDKIYAEEGRFYQEVIIRRHLDLSALELQKNPDSEILVWPETAVPDYLDDNYLDRSNQQMIIKGIADLKASLITGGYSRKTVPQNSGRPLVYNALFFLDPSGKNTAEPYSKTELLAFGEYLPLSEQFPFLLKLFPFIANFGRGPGPTMSAMPVGDSSIRWGGQICYEGLFPEFTRKLAAKDSQIILNVTNDSWFGSTFEPYQHLYMTLGRAIEVRRPLLRSTNTGISTAVLANGAVLQKSPLHEVWSGQFEIKYQQNPEQTFFTRWGHWTWVLILGIVLAIIFVGAINARSRRS